MNTVDTLFGRIKNGVLTLSGNAPSIRVDGGYLVVSDGPVIVPPDHKGEALPPEKRMVTCRFRRADCPVSRIIVTRPDGFVTFGATKWMHDVGVGLVQLDWDGTVIVATGPAGTDQPALRRAQVLAAGTVKGHAITRELLVAKLTGQAAVADALGERETATIIRHGTEELKRQSDPAHLLSTEAMAASIYWPLWLSVPVRFARRYAVPEHWLTFGSRRSPLSGKPLKAATPGNAVLNYLYGVLAGEMTIALSAVGLDPGLGFFHTDRDRRASLAHDAMEAIRPYVDGWLLAWLASARFAKRDFFEEADGAIRLTRPLSSHLAMTAAIWRPAAQAVASWLAQALNANTERPPTAPFPGLPTPRRTWQGLEPPMPTTCHECGTALAPKQRKFCSQKCSVAFHVATTTVGQLITADAPRSIAEPVGSGAAQDGVGAKNRRNLALRRAWDLEHPPSAGVAQAAKAHGRNTWAIPMSKKSQEWFETELLPRLQKQHYAQIQHAAGVSKRYALMIRNGYVPHPRHYSSLAELVGIKPPAA